MQDDTPKPDLPEAAKRALAEAAERRRIRDEEAARKPPRPVEVNGQKGPDPTRFGDWEKDGIVSDF
jgi:hypothetical protein